MRRRNFLRQSGAVGEDCPKRATEHPNNSRQLSTREFRSRPIASGNFGNPEGALHPGAFFFGYFLLGKQKKVTCRRAAPGIGDSTAEKSALRLLQIFRRNTLRYSALRAALCIGDNVPMKIHKSACRPVAMRVPYFKSLRFYALQNLPPTRHSIARAIACPRYSGRHRRVTMSLMTCSLR
jgi:hypothetical protein